MKNIVIFASGSGSNAENMMIRFNGKGSIRVVAVFCNKQNAGVIERANNYLIPTVIFNTADFASEVVVKELEKYRPDLIVLAGFLLKFPTNIINQYSGRIVNIHPALLPKYGGKGMYGINVHRAVVDNMERETGITIHLVNENYDEGAIVFQKSIPLNGSETCEEVAEKVQRLEHLHFGEVIEELINRQKF